MSVCARVCVFVQLACKVLSGVSVKSAAAAAAATAAAAAAAPTYSDPPSHAGQALVSTRPRDWNGMWVTYEGASYAVGRVTSICCGLCDPRNRRRKCHNTHPASFLLQFVHRPICDAEAVQLGVGVAVLVLKAIDAALDELHVVLCECARLVREDVFHLQAARHGSMTGVASKTQLLKRH